MIEVEGPGGVVIEFPDGTTREVMQSAMQKHFAPKADDHGLARRQAMSPVEKAISPFTEWPRNTREASTEATHQLGTGLNQLYEGAFQSGLAGDVGKFAAGLGNTAFGAMGAVAAPITGTYRSLIGQPVEDVTGIPREYTEFAAQLATPWLGFTKVPGARAPGAPGAPAVPSQRIVITKPDELPPTLSTQPSGAEAAQAMQRLRDEGINVDLPRSITSDSPSVQRTGQWASNVPVVGDPLKVAAHDTVPAQIRDARDILAARRGSATEANAAGRAGQFVSEAAAAEARAAEEAAATSDSAVLAAHQKAIDDANAAIAAREAQSGQSVEAQTGRANPQDTGALATEKLRAAEAAAKAEKNRLYKIAGEAEGVVKSDALPGLEQRIRGNLDEANINVEYPSSTPKSIDMLNEVKKFEGGLFKNAPIVEAPPSAAPRVAPVAAKEAAVAAPSAQSLTEFLASKGGLGPDSELGAIGADKHLVNVEGAGRRKLVKQGGWTLDYAREAAQEAGYLKGGQQGTSTTRDLLDALDAEMRGNKLYPEGFEGSVGKREATAASERARHEYDAHISGLEDDLASAGYDRLGPDVKQRAVNLMDRERLDPDTAVEHAIKQLEQEDAAGASGFPGDRAAQPAVAQPAARPVAIHSGVTLNGIERFRQNLRSIAKNAERGSSDELAAKKIIDHFDDWHNDAMQSSLLSGDPKALEKFQEARAANRDWREKFGYNERNDVNNLIQKILHQDVTPNEVANYLIGSGKIGNQGTTSRIYKQIMNATGGNPELAQSIQGAIWDRLSSSPTAAKDIREFVHKSGQDLAEKVFPEGSRELMLRHADMLDQGKAAREVVTDIAKNTQPGKVPVEKGPMQQLVARVIGGKVDKPEALWKTIEGYTTKGGDVGALARLMRELPPEMKGDIAGAVVRGLGDSARTGQFSLDTFASDWGRITPQAKQILFGNDGAHVKALDDIAVLSQRLKDVQKKYGNPSGTAQNTALTTLFSTLTGVVGGTGSPWAAATMLGTAAGGYLGARILAKPATASSIAKHMKAVERAAENPTAQNLAIASMTERNMLNTIKTLGATRTPPQSPRLLQGPVPAGAQNEQR